MAAGGTAAAAIEIVANLILVDCLGRAILSIQIQKHYMLVIAA